MRKPVELLLYTKEECPLCGEMEEAANKAAETLPLRLTHVDVTKDPSLFARYGMDIPLLFMDGSCIAKHRTTAGELEEKVRRRLCL